MHNTTESPAQHASRRLLFCCREHRGSYAGSVGGACSAQLTWCNILTHIHHLQHLRSSSPMLCCFAALRPCPQLAISAVLAVLLPAGWPTILILCSMAFTGDSQIRDYKTETASPQQEECNNNKPHQPAQTSQRTATKPQGCPRRVQQPAQLGRIQKCRPTRRAYCVVPTGLKLSGVPSTTR